MRLAWLSDLHWERKRAEERLEHIDWIRAARPDAMVLSGDIGEATSLADFLSTLHESLPFPIYFVLGNHDFWHGELREVRAAARELARAHANLHYLSVLETVPLSRTGCLVGYEGWGDGRAGDPGGARDFPHDFLYIADLIGLSREERFTRIAALGDEFARRLREKLLPALRSYQHIYVVTHVPPFPEACIDSYRICHKHKLPFYCCQAVGEMLQAVAREFSGCKLIVLCGHTHNECELEVGNNLKVMVKEASYIGCHEPTIIDDVPE